MKNVYIILDNIRSTHNVGSILRTADAAGVTKAYFCGYTPTPIDRFGRKRSDVAKVALGAEETVSWEYVEDVKELLKTLKEKGVRVVALEQDKRSVPYTKYRFDGDVAVLLGEETHGITKDVLTLCDDVVEIPMRGKKESLNVSVATGIVLFRLTEDVS